MSDRPRRRDYLLVHGSGQNASCWERVAGHLAARGHGIVTPELPKQAPGWGLQDYGASIARAVPGPRTIVVAHSFSGVFLPLVAGLRDCARIVFLAAVIPEPGRSVREQATEDPGMFSPAWLEAGPRWFDGSQVESLAREFLFHDCDEATIRWAIGTMEIFDTRHLVTEAAPFRRWPDVPATCIVATGDRTLTADWGRRAGRRLPESDVCEIDAGHCPMVSRPGELARLLERIAEGRHPSGGAT